MNCLQGFGEQLFHLQKTMRHIIENNYFASDTGSVKFRRKRFASDKN